MTRILRLGWVVLVLFLMVGVVNGQTDRPFVLSTTVDVTLGGLPFGEDDLAEYDPATNSAIPFFDGDWITSGSADIDAVSILSNGHLVLSTENGETLGGLSFRDGDLVEYDPATNTATLFFDEDRFTAGAADIDAVSVLPNGHIVLSTTVDVTLGGLAFGADDLAEYDPASDTAILLFDGALFTSGSVDIDAVSVLPNGDIVLSTENAETLAGLSFSDGDLVKYNSFTKKASLFFGEGSFTAGAADIDAVAGRCKAAQVCIDGNPCSQDLCNAGNCMSIPAVGTTVYEELVRANGFCEQNPVTGCSGDSECAGLGPCVQAKFEWRTPISFEVGIGEFTTPVDIGLYNPFFFDTGSGTFVADPANPTPGEGFWYLFRPVCDAGPASWQTTLGAEPERDVALP